jgi:beta-galactosidase
MALSTSASPTASPSRSSPAPFLWGAQYYRAPTPAADCWQQDHARMRRLGFTDVKYWAQWGWSQRSEQEFVFDDLDRLLDLALTHDLRVTINTIFDVAPQWLLARHPECRQVTSDGRTVQSRAVSFRQIGGFPGPCLRHGPARAERERFLAATVRRFRGHRALAMWDVWNEPEQSFPSREPRPGNYVCYCEACRSAFIPYLQARHDRLDALNRRWGRCYQQWREVEPPINAETLVDWLDWREFQLDGMTQEASWRMRLVRELDPEHTTYLHVVPNTMDVFNAVSGADDFALAELGEVFAATCNGGPQWMHQLVSAGAGKRCYNVESHINFGSTVMHQRLNGLREVARDLLPQLGMGISGFLFWQFRSETLGQEAPAWGIVRPDGADRPVTAAIERFGAAILPYRAQLMACTPSPARIGIWKSRRNEIFHYGAHTSLAPLIEAVDGYVQALYWRNLPFRFVNERMLAAGELPGIAVLILPSPYCLGADEARALERFLVAGGKVLSEAHLGAWDPDTGRHSPQVPGQGLAASWGLVETDTTASALLSLGQLEQFTGALSDDVAKALRACGASGGQFFPITVSDGSMWWGSERLAILGGSRVHITGSCAGLPCVGAVAVGAGEVLYVGTRWGQSARKDATLFADQVASIMRGWGVEPSSQGSGVHHLDVLSGAGQARFVVGVGGDGPSSARCALPGSWRGLFSGVQGSFNDGFPLQPGTAELFVPA